MATLDPSLPNPHLLIVLPDPIADRPPQLRRPETVIVERSLPPACLLCRGLGWVDIRPATHLFSTPIRMPCPHCQQHIPLVLRYLPTGGTDVQSDPVPDRRTP